MSSKFTFLGLLINLVGVAIVFLYSKKLTGNISPFDKKGWHYFKGIVDWGVRVVMIGTGFQLLGALVDLVKQW